MESTSDAPEMGRVRQPERMKMLSIKDRFEAFAATLDGYESIDALMIGDPTTKKRADYLFKGRSIIAEQKVLEVDPDAKIQPFIDKLMNEGKLLFFGKMTTTELFANHPEGKKFQQALYSKVVSRIEKIFKDADKQTRDTKAHFELPDAAGLLIILNEAATILDPEVICHKLHNMFGRANEDGSFRYPHNNLTLLISEIHTIPSSTHSKVFPIITMFGPTFHHPLAEAFVKELSQRWASYNTVDFIEGKVEALGWQSLSK